MLGFPSVDTMLGLMTSHELSEWKAYFQVKQSLEREHQEIEERKQRAKKANG